MPKLTLDHCPCAICIKCFEGMLYGMVPAIEVMEISERGGNFCGYSDALQKCRRFNVSSVKIIYLVPTTGQLLNYLRSSPFPDFPLIGIFRMLIHVPFFSVEREGRG
jgi:hypothetical protein